MIGKTVRAATQVLGGLGAGVAIVLVLLAWRLSTGPIHLDFLTPHLEDLLNAPDAPVVLRLEDTVLTWAGWRRTLDVRLIDARLFDGDGGLVARVPEMALSLSGRSLLQGRVAPRRIDLFGPSLRAVRTQDGGWELGMGGGAVAAAGQGGPESVLDELRADPDPAKPLSYLKRLQIHDGRLTLVDEAQGTTWVAPAVQATLARGRDGFDVALSADIDIDGTTARIDLSAIVDRETDAVSLDLEAGNVIASSLARIDPALAPLADMHLPLSGHVTLAATLHGEVEAAQIDLACGAGTIHLPAPLSHDLPVREAVLRGGYLAAEGRLTILEASAAFPEEAHLKVPPKGHPVPLRRIDGSAQIWLDGNRIEVPGIVVDLGGPRAVVDVTAEGDTGNRTVQAEATFRDIPFDRLEELWPKGQANDARDWVTVHLSKGRVREGTVRVTLASATDGTLAVGDMTGTMSADGVTVDYLPPMPEVVGVSADARFNRKRFDIDLHPVRQGDIEIVKGRVSLVDLDTGNEKAQIDLHLDSTARAALELIDHEPFKFASAVGMVPERVGGAGRTHLKMAFALEKDLDKEEVEIDARAQLEGVQIRDIVRDLDLSLGLLSLEADNKGMEIRGEAKVGSIPASLSWIEHFTDDRPFRRRYHVQGTISDAQRIDEIGLDFAPFTPDFMRGPALAEVRYTVGDSGTNILQTRLDLRDMELNLSGLGWAKPAGRDGHGEAELLFSEDRLDSVPRFLLRAGDLLIEGRVDFAEEETRLRSVQFDRFLYGRTDLSGIVVPQDGGGWDADFEGESFDMERVLEALADRSREGLQKEGDLPPVTLSANVRHLWLGEGRELTQVAGAMAHDGEKWRSIRLQGQVGDGKPVTLSIRPVDGKRMLEVTSEDAGATLKAFDFYDRMVGGTLDLKGTFHDSLLDSPLSGILNIKDYRLVKAPTVAQVISYLSVTGLIEALDGEDGLKFATLEIPFLHRDRVLEVKEGKATGLSLGGTLSGKYDKQAETVDFKGTVVPAYVLNSVLGKIPLLGDLLTGGEEGGGIFAATYKVSGPIEQPEVSVNALSALAPGFLRNLFGALVEQAESETSAPPPVDSLTEPTEGN